LALEYSEDAFEMAKQNKDINLMVLLAWSLCLAYLPTGLYRKIIDLVPDVVDLLEKTGKVSELFSMPMPPYTVLCSYWGVSMGFCGDFDEGKILLEKALRNASEANSLFALGLAELLSGQFFATRGNWEASLGHFQNSIKYFDETQWTWVAAIARIFLGYACSMLGDPETGRKHAGKGIEIQRNSGVEIHLAVANYLAGLIHMELQDLKNARSFTQEALRLSEKNNEKATQGRAWISLGRILGQEEPPQTHKAEECIEKGMEILQDLKATALYSPGYLYLGELYLNAGETEKATKNLEKAENMFKEMRMGYWLDKTQEVEKGL